MYKITKTIRFKLDAQSNTELAKESEKLKEYQDFSLVKFVDKCEKFISLLKDHLYCSDANNNPNNALKKSISVKKTWLRLYARDIYYENSQINNSTVREFSVTKIEELSELIKNWFGRFEELTKLLNEKVTEQEHNLSRHSAIGLLIKRMSVRNNFPFISSFIENSNNKSETGTLSLQIKKLRIEIELMLEMGLKVYLPAQSNGFPLVKASFNYYTIFKNPVDFEEQIKQQKEKLRICNIDNDIQQYNRKHDGKYIIQSNNKKIMKFIIDEVKELAKNHTLLLGNAPEFESDNVVFLRQILKNIKSKQKKAFNELMQQENLNYEKFKLDRQLFLFNSITKDEFDKYQIITKQIEKKAIERNSSDNNDHKKQLMSEIENLKRDRGKSINGAEENTKNKFVVYKLFCNFYRGVAQRHGRILTLIKGIEKERIESQQLKYWAAIAEKGNKQMLVLIPKEADKAKTCREFINANQNSLGSTKIYWFESLTLRSLRKLCFGYLENKTNTNTFYPEIKKELSCPKYCDQKQRFLEGEYFFINKNGQKDEGKLIKFYKDVLASNYVKETLNLPFEHLQKAVLTPNFTTLDDFAVALEKVCYRRKVICKDDLIEKLHSDYNAQVFEITTLDLRNKEKNNLKIHTQLWKSFWDEENERKGFDVRLNPDITISWRNAKESRVKKYGQNSNLYDKNKKNRYLYPQYTLITTISENNNSPTKNISFMKQDEFEKQIKCFNQNIKKDDVKFAIGIDNGKIELSSLSVYMPEFRINENISYQDNISHLKNTKYKFPVLTITQEGLDFSKNHNNKTYKLINNPSYFLNKEFFQRTFNATEEDYNEVKNKCFQESQLLSLDLTIAKVINGSIVMNGDIASFLSLKLKDAQKIIYELNDHIKKATNKQVTIKCGSELTSDEINKFTDQQTGEKETYRKKYAYNFFAVISSANEAIKTVMVFYNREYFKSLMNQDQIKAKLDQYNTKREISNEELSLKINHLKRSIVANAIGIIDFLYKYYKSMLDGYGIIIKEGFDSKKIESDLEAFRGNIYRMLEWGLYRKFQNYGLVPPIKDLLSIRGEGINDNNENEIVRLGNIGFVCQKDTSQKCPVCGRKNDNSDEYLENKKKKKFLCDHQDCNFNIEYIMHSDDGVAAFNIAQRGFENFQNETIKD
jgi:hypothetical protein